jgi:hypothetical protein
VVDQTWWRERTNPIATASDGFNFVVDEGEERRIHHHQRGLQLSGIAIEVP